jgi:hypothetical protein
MSMLIERAQQNHPASWRRLAAGTLILTGVAHLAAGAFAPASPEQTARLEVLRSWRVSLPGAERNFGELFLGFSVMMGVLLIGSGALIGAARPTRSSRVVMVTLTLMATAIAWRYFFAVPGALTAVAAFAALMDWIGEARAASGIRSPQV